MDAFERAQLELCQQHNSEMNHDSVPLISLPSSNQQIDHIDPIAPTQEIKEMEQMEKEEETEELTVNSM